MKKTVIIILSVFLALAIAGCVYALVLLGDARKENTRLETVLGSMRLAETESADTNAALNEQLKAQEGKLADLNKALEALRAENETLTATVTERDTKLAALEKAAGEHVSTAAEQTTAIETLNASLASLKADLEAKDTAVSELNARLEQADAALLAARQTADGQAASIKTLEQEKADLAAAQDALTAQLTAERAEKEAAAQTHQRKLQTKDDELAEKARAIEALEQNTAELTASLSRISTSLEQKETTDADIKALAAQLNQCLDLIRTESARLIEEGKQKSQEIEELRVALKQKGELITALQTQLSLLETPASLPEDTARILEDSRTIGEKTAEIIALTASLAEKDKTIAALNAEIAEKQKDIEAQIAEIAALAATLPDREKTIEVLRADVDAKQKVIDEKAAEIAALTAAVAEKQTAIDALSTEITEKRADIDALNADVAAKQTDIDAKAAEIAALTATVVEKQTAIDALNTEITEKSADIDTLNADVTAKQTDIDAKTAEIAALTATVAEKSAGIDALNADVTAKQTDIDAKAAEIAALTATVAEKSADIDALNTDVANKQADINAKAAEITALTATVAEKSAGIDALNADVANKQADIDAKAAEIAALNDTLAQRDQTIKDNETEIDELKQRLTVKNPLDNYGGASLEGNTLYARAAKLMEDAQWKEAQALLLPSTEENEQQLLTICNSQCFLADLQNGLLARWALAGEDTSVMSNEKTIEYYASLVNAELNHIGMYASLTLDDETLTAYAGTYISALNNQLVGIEEFFSTDTDNYFRYWQEEGYNRRAQILYRIHKEYGLDALKGSAVFKDMVNTGEHLNLYVMAERSLAPQLLTKDFKLINAKARSVTLNPFTLTNTSSCTLESVTLKLHLYDAQGDEVDSLQLYYDDNILPGAKMKSAGKRIDKAFARYAVECRVDIQSASYKDSFSFMVEPLAQFGWDGEVHNAPVAAGEPAYQIEQLDARWTMHTAWGETKYVPSVRFGVKNIGTEKSGAVVVRCEFVNEQDQTKWSTETSYITGPNDAFLNPGDSKRAFLYSSVGFGEALNPAALPDITANIYINGVLAETVKIDR